MNYLTTNKYEYPELEWYLHNDFGHYLNLLEKAEIPENYRKLAQTMFDSQANYEDRKEFFMAELYMMKVEEPLLFSAPENALVDLLMNASAENYPKILYLIDNPEEMAIPASFNPITHPEYFEDAIDDEDDYQSRDTYNDVLKKAMDVRNNKLDARRINAALSTEQIVALATNKLTISNEELKLPAVEADVEAKEIPDIITPQVPPAISAKFNSLMESKKQVVTQKPSFNLDDLLGGKK